MRLLLLFISLTLAPLSQAQGQYMSTESFLQKAFSGEVKTDETQVLWLTRESKKIAERILQHPVRALRMRYWQHAGKTAWILNEIGKEKPITIGVVVNKQTIEFIEILAFRESRGWEVRQPFFTQQFQGAWLEEKKQGLRLSEHIDGITGATLSVAAVRRSSILALFLHQLVTKADES